MGVNFYLARRFSPLGPKYIFAWPVLVSYANFMMETVTLHPSEVLYNFFFFFFFLLLGTGYAFEKCIFTTSQTRP